jgi:hypothetical protein
MLDAALRRAEEVERLQHDAVRTPEAASPVRSSGVEESAEPAAVAMYSPSAGLARSGPKSQKEVAEPKHEAVDLVAAPPSPCPAPSASAADPAVTWEESLRRLRKIAQETASKPSSDQGSALWQVRAQVVDWLCGQPAGPAGEALLRKAVTTIADAMKTQVQDSTARSAQIRSAVLALEDRVPLGIADLRLCRNVLGFGAFEPLDSSSLKAGQEVIVYCELTGLRYEEREGSFISRLRSRVELLAPRDGAHVWDQSLGEAEDQCRSRRRDNYVNYRINLPPSLSPGEYRLRLIQTDLVANRTTASELPLTVTR